MKKSSVLAAACALVSTFLLASSSEGAPALKDVFEAYEHRYTGGQYQEELFRYRLFVPRKMKPGQRYPLLVWLHGLGENGSDNERSLGWLQLILNDLTHVDKYHFFILVVQCPAANPSWSRGPAGASGGKSDDMMDVAFEILRKRPREASLTAGVA